MADKEKVIIFAALTGAGTLKAKCPALPTTPEEIAEDAYQCWKAGAAVVHLHMRDDDTMPTMDPEKYVQTVTLLREKYPDCDVVIRNQRGIISDAFFAVRRNIFGLLSNHFKSFHGSFAFIVGSYF